MKLALQLHVFFQRSLFRQNSTLSIIKKNDYPSLQRGFCDIFLLI